MAFDIVFRFGIIMIASTIVALIAKRFKQPLLFAYLITGVIIGPIGLALISNTQDILVFSELGVAFLLFAIGIESNFSKLFRMKYLIVFGSLLQVAVTTAIVFALMGVLGFGFIESLYVGLILAFSSTVIAVKYLSDKNQINTLHGRLIIGFAIVQDLVAVMLLPLLARPETIFDIGLLSGFLIGLAVLFVLAVLLNKLLLPRLLKSNAKNQELFFLIVISTGLGFMYVANLVNFSIAVGAFIGGLTLSNLPYNTEALSRIRGLRDFFTTIFFVSLGMQLTLSIAAFPIALAVLMFLTVYLLNPLIYYLITYFAGYGSRNALTVGLALEQASEFSFILAAQALMLGQMSQGVYSVAILVIVVSMATTPYMLESSSKAYSFLHSVFKRLFPKYSSKKFNRKLKELEYLPKEELEGHIVILGSGVFGNSVAAVLRNYATVVLIDHNPSNILSNIKKRLYSVYGNGESEEVWQKANIEGAKIVISTIPDTRAAMSIIKRLREANEKSVIFARAHNFEEALQMYKLGVESVIMPQVLGSNECIRQIQNFLNTGKTISSKLKNEFINYLKGKAALERKYS